MLVLSRKESESVVLRVRSRVAEQVSTILESDLSDAAMLKQIREAVAREVPEEVRLRVLRVARTSVRLGTEADVQHVHVLRSELCDAA